MITRLLRIASRKLRRTLTTATKMKWKKSLIIMIKILKKSRTDML